MTHAQIPHEVTNWIGQQLFEHVPSNIMVINRDFKLLTANQNFTSVFGEINGKHCYEVFKKSDKVCDNCMAVSTFEQGKVFVGNEYGIDRHGQPAFYVVHTVPIRNEDDEVAYVIEMSYDVTDSKPMKQYNILFERVPCYVAVLDRELKIVRANEMLRNMFGETRGQHCFQVYKRRNRQCENCPAMKTFLDGGTYTQKQVGINKRGMLTHYIVSTAPLSRSGDRVNHVVEMSIDVTETQKLTQDLMKESYFRHQLTENSLDALVGSDASGLVNMFNPAAERLFKVSASDIIAKRSARDFLPEEFDQLFEEAEGALVVPDTAVVDAEGATIPVRFSATVIGAGADVIGAAAFLQDLRAFKRCQQEKLMNERLAVIGQTVAQLSHGMKNILTGVQSGLYAIRMGIKRNETQRLSVGWERLDRNFKRLNELVRDFLKYAKEHIPERRTTDLKQIAEEVCQLFQDVARDQDIDLTLETDQEIPTLDADPKDLHVVLSNLVSNAIDACKEKRPDDAACSVAVRVTHDEDGIHVEVEDTGCGMDDKTKEQVFNTFFTTKGIEGTGLGLLVTQKLVHANGGVVSVVSTLHEGSIFRVDFPNDDVDFMNHEPCHSNETGDSHHDQT